jgi:hypothetical protein
MRNLGWATAAALWGLVMFLRPTTDKSVELAVVDQASGNAGRASIKELVTREWAQATVDLSGWEPQFADEIHFLLPKGAEMFVDDLVLFEPAQRADLDWIRPSHDKTHFVRESSDERIVMWGFNYDRDDSGRLLEDYWGDEWATVAEDFREMKALGANVVRIHLQLSRFMTGPDRPDISNLQRLGKLVRLAEESGLYLDITGLGCYHKQDVPAWYDALDEAARWAVQARFWKEVAAVCKNSPAIFCYDLMNEPIVAGGDKKNEWLPGPPLAGKHYVQRITTDARGRSDKEIARAWVATLAGAIRSVIPWAQVFKGAKPLFYAPEVCGPLDFVSVHFYPKAVDLEESLAALKVYEIGKPLVIEEIFPLGASIEKTEQFIQKSRPHVDGYISFYWGKTIDENKRKGDVGGALMSQWLERFSALSPYGHSK